MDELKEFFTPRKQFALIQTVQMQNETFEDALTQYCQAFICDLTDILVRNEGILKKGNTVRKIKEYIGLQIDKPDEEPQKYVFKDSITTEFFGSVIKCHNDWISCQIRSAIDEIERQIQCLMTPNPEVNQMILVPEKTANLYRGRISQTRLGKNDMFHIGFRELHKIRNQRFSLVGQPLLYLGASVRCVAEEMQINSMHQEQIEQLFISQYTLIAPEREPNQETVQPLCLYDMRLYIQESFFDNNQDDTVRENQYKRFLLSCVCSFSNYHSQLNAHFIEEYIIPQLVTQEIRKCEFNEKKQFDGICYYSTRFIPEEEKTPPQTIAVGKNRMTINDKRPIQTIFSSAENYAFFTEKSRDIDLPWDSQLRKRFVITMPVSISELRRNSISFSGSENGVLSFKDGVKVLEDYFTIRDAQKKALKEQEWFSAYQTYKKERGRKEYFK